MRTTMWSMAESGFVFAMALSPFLLFFAAAGFLLAAAGGGGRCAAEPCEQGFSVGYAQTRAGIPSRARRITYLAAVRPVVALGDPAKPGGVRVQLREKKTDWFLRPLVDEGGEPRPQRSDGARATDHLGRAVDDDAVARAGSRIAGDVGHAAAFAAIVETRRQRRFLLEGRHGEQIADAAAAAVRAVVPDGLVGDGVAGDGDVGAAAANDPRARRRKIDVCLAIGNAVGGKVIPRGHEDGYAERRRILQRRVHRI